MQKILPQLKRQLSEDALQRIHTCALKLVEEIGIQIKDSGLRNRFTKFPGCSIRNDRLCLNPALVQEFIIEHQRKATNQNILNLGHHPKPHHSDLIQQTDSDNQLRLHPYDYASQIMDIETNEIRPITERDLIEMTKLVDVLNVSGYPIYGGCPGFAQDLPEPLRAIAQYKIGAEYSRTPTSVDLPTIPATKYIFQMMQVMGETRLGLSLFMFNPLRVDEASLERIVHFVDSGYPVSIGVGHMPLLGATTPITLGGALAQSAAEILAGFSMIRLLAPKVPANLRIQLFAFDMRYSNIALGAPEEALLAKICQELTVFYGGLESPNPYIFSSSKLPNQQSAAEKTGTALYKALSGVRTFTVGGATASEVFSPEQLIIDCEIIGYVNRIIQGFEMGDPMDELEMISEGIEREYYLDTISTATRHRDTYWRPRLFEHSTFRQWQEKKPPDLTTRSKKIVREMIQKHDYQLDPSKIQMLQDIYLQAKSELVEN